MSSSLENIQLKNDLSLQEAAEVIKDTLGGSDELKNADIAKAESEGVRVKPMIIIKEGGEIIPLMDRRVHIDDYVWFTLAPVYLGLCINTSFTQEFLESPRGADAVILKCATPIPISSRMPTWNDVIEGVDKTHADVFFQFLESIAIQQQEELWVIEWTRVAMSIGDDDAAKNIPLYVITPATATLSFAPRLDQKGGLALSPIQQGNPRAQIHADFTKEKLG